MGAGNARTWYIGANEGTDTNCPTGVTLKEIHAGEVITLVCRERTTGTLPPGAATTITVRGYADNAAFGTPATTGIWTWASPNCASDVTTTRYCTVDGTNGAAPYYGFVRLMVNAVRTTVPTYDVNSDQTTWGVYYCNPRITAFTDGNPTSSPTTYVGSDTYRTSVTYDSTKYTSGVSARVDLICDSATTVPGSIEPGTSAVTTDATIKGRPDQWPTGCTITQKLVITKTSAISGLTSSPIYKFDTGSAPSGVTFNGARSEATRTTKPLNRILTVASCAENINAETGITRAHRGEAVTTTCVLTNARSEFIASGRLSTGWTQRATQSAYDTTDFLSTDFTVGSNGAATWTSTAKTTATNTNGTAPLDYVAEARTWGSSRTDAELYNWGNSTGILDVSTAFNVPVNSWRTACSGTQTSVFIIASDIAAMTEGPTQDTRGNVVTRSLTSSRTYIEADTSAAIASDSANGITTGTSPCHSITPVAPASTKWDVTATITDANGNSGTGTRRLTFLSPYANPYQINIIGATLPSVPGKTVPIQVRTLKLDAVTGLMEPQAPDQTPVYRVNYTTPTGEWQTHLNPTSCVANALSVSTYWCNVTIPSSWKLGQPAVFQVWTNMSGLIVTNRADLLVLPPLAGGDPFTISAHDIHIGQTQNITLQLHWDNGTARTGAATNVTLWVADQATGALVVNGANPTEWTVSGNVFGYYYYTFQPAAGTFVIIANQTTDLNEARSAPAKTFTVTAPPATQASADYYGQTSLIALNTTRLNLDATRTDINSTRATITGIDANVSSANNTASGGLTQAAFNQWRDGEARPTSARVNQTLETSIFNAWVTGDFHPTLNLTATGIELANARAEARAGTNTTSTALTLMLNQIRLDGNDTRSYLPAKWLETHATLVKPKRADLAMLLVGGIGLTLAGAARSSGKRDRRAQLVLAGVALLIAFFTVNQTL